MKQRFAWLRLAQHHLLLEVKLLSICKAQKIVHGARTTRTSCRWLREVPAECPHAVRAAISKTSLKCGDVDTSGTLCLKSSTWSGTCDIDCELSVYAVVHVLSFFQQMSGSGCNGLEELELLDFERQVVLAQAVEVSLLSRVPFLQRYTRRRHLTENRHTSGTKGGRDQL